MQKNIYNYLPLYVGCNVEIRKINKGGIAIEKLTPDNLKSMYSPEVSVRLFLRHLSDMSTKEMQKAESVYFEAIKEHGRGVLAYAEITNWYRDNGFDIDSLIAEGIAIQSKN